MSVKVPQSTGQGVSKCQLFTGYWLPMVGLGNQIKSNFSRNYVKVLSKWTFDFYAGHPHFTLP